MTRPATIIRWQARVLSAPILLVWGFFLVAPLFAGGGHSSGRLATRDSIALAAIVISLLGLAVSWKWELMGGVTTLLAYVILAAINPSVLAFPYLLFPIAGASFVSSWCLRRTVWGGGGHEGDNLEAGNGRRKRLAVWILPGAVIPLMVIAGIPGGCSPMSIREKSKSAGFNGSFEIEKSGLPVNWYIHYPPIKNKDAEVFLDTTEAVEGKQSLKFVVHHVAGGRWRSAGLFQVSPAKAKHTYNISFWLKNQGCKVSLFVRSENPKVSPPPRRMVFDAENTGTNTWRRFECEYTVPEDYHNIRFELDILRPGILWVDDVRIQEVQRD